MMKGAEFKFTIKVYEDFFLFLFKYLFKALTDNQDDLYLITSSEIDRADKNTSLDMKIPESFLY